MNRDHQLLAQPIKRQRSKRQKSAYRRETELAQLMENDENNGNHPVNEDDLSAGRVKLFESGSTFLPCNRDDIVGVDNILVEIDEVIHWLNNADEYRKYKSRLEPGLVFEGSPGVGKTMVARYIATQANALFVNVRDFPHKKSLLNDRDIAELFRLARETYVKTQSPIVLFWDEFEANAAERIKVGADQASASAQLTAELDGVHGKNEGILLIGCTNYIHMIDQALLRPGRMGIQIEFSAPNREGKELLLKHYLAKTQTVGEIDIATLSYFFEADSTAAEIEEAVMEAWRYAVRRSFLSQQEVALAQEDLVKMFVKRLVGPPTAFVDIPKNKRRVIALHEAGHALMALIYGVPVRLITVQPGKDTLGKCITAEVEEYIGTHQDLVNQMRVVLGSIAAESAADVAPGLGTGGDIRMANDIARRLVDDLNYGVNLKCFNPAYVAEMRGSMDGPSPSISDRALNVADEEIRKLLDNIDEDSRRVMLRVGADALWDIADALNDRVTLTGSEFSEAVARVLGTDNFAKYRI